jgi:cell cycle checkpoint control protein RAD9A
MHTLSFTLTLQGVVRVHDAVMCLAKFSEIVSLEARRDKVRTSTYVACGKR